MFGFLFALYVLALQFTLSFAFTLDIPATVQANSIQNLIFTRTNGDADTWAINITNADTGETRMLDNSVQQTLFQLSGSVPVLIPPDVQGNMNFFAVSPDQPDIWFAQSPLFLVTANPFSPTTTSIDPGVSVNGIITPTPVPSDTTAPSATVNPSDNSIPSASASASETQANALSSSSHVAVIAGAIFGSVVFFLVLTGLILYLRLRKDVNGQPKRPMTFYRDRMVRSAGVLENGKFGEGGFDGFDSGTGPGTRSGYTAGTTSVGGATTTIASQSSQSSWPEMVQTRANGPPRVFVKSPPSPRALPPLPRFG